MSLNDYWIHTFLGQVELLELGSFLVELGLQLLLEFDKLGPLLLQSRHSLLEHLWMMEEKKTNTHTHNQSTVKVKNFKASSFKLKERMNKFNFHSLHHSMFYKKGPKRIKITIINNSERQLNVSVIFFKHKWRTCSFSSVGFYCCSSSSVKEN